MYERAPNAILGPRGVVALKSESRGSDELIAYSRAKVGFEETLEGTSGSLERKARIDDSRLRFTSLS